ncbi:hypothetical protein [Streptosporangium sandarakinum]
MLAMLPVAARQILGAMMRTGTREYKSEYARHYFGQGKAQGIAEGEAKMPLLVLTGRGIEVPEDARARIMECTDLALIERWGRRVGTVDTIDELFGWSDARAEDVGRPPAGLAPGRETGKAAPDRAVGQPRMRKAKPITPR